jgi:hypothetical protein
MLILDISSIQNIKELIEIKEQIKNQITEKMTWQERMELYKQIQLINERIEELNVPS